MIDDDNDDDYYCITWIMRFCEIRWNFISVEAILIERRRRNLSRNESFLDRWFARRESENNEKLLSREIVFFKWFYDSSWSFQIDPKVMFRLIYFQLISAKSRSDSSRF